MKQNQREFGNILHQHLESVAKQLDADVGCLVEEAKSLLHKQAASSFYFDHSNKHACLPVTFTRNNPHFICIKHIAPSIFKQFVIEAFEKTTQLLKEQLSMPSCSCLTFYRDKTFLALFQCNLGQTLAEDEVRQWINIRMQRHRCQ